MTEIYPTDSELQNILSEPETGVEYIATGTAPYYIEFRRMLYRLLLAVRRANDLRAYKEGGLDIGVKGGKYWAGTAFISYPGSTGNVLADDKDAIYIYLDMQGDLVTDEYVSFPDMATERHIRLAIVSTSEGDIVSLDDARDYHSISVPGVGSGGGGVSVVEDHINDDILTEQESGSVHTNRGAAGIVTLTLPVSSQAGVYFIFSVQGPYQLRIDPGAATIRDDSGQTAGRYKWADSVGECIQLISDNNGDWITVAKSGIWSEEI